MSIYSDYINQRNAYVKQRATVPWPGWGSQGDQPYDPAYEDEQKRLRDEWLAQLSPAQQADALAHFQGKADTTSKINKYGKIAALATIGAAAGGAALTAGGVIGSGAAAGTGTAAGTGAVAPAAASPFGLGPGTVGAAGLGSAGGAGVVGGAGTMATAAAPFSLGGLGLKDIGGLATSAAGIYSALRPTPDAPDYGALATQQGDQNLQAALVNAQLNRLNETNPYGSVNYGRTADPNAPGGYTYNREIKLSPEQQQLYNLESGNQISGQQVAGSMQDRVAQSVAQPFSLAPYGEAQKFGTAADYAGGAKAVGDALYQRQLALRQPGMEKDVSSLDTQLKNQGLMPGSEAYNWQLQQLRQQQGQDLNDLAGRATEAQGAEQSRLAGLDLNFGGFNNQVRTQGIQEGLLQRQQPLTEFNAFRTGNTPTLPQFQPFGMTQVQPTQTYGAAKDQYQGAVNQYNAKSGQLQSLLNFGANYFGGP